MINVKRALISVSDKSGLVEFAKGLQEFGIEIISTGGTHNLLKEGGVAVKKVSEVTEFPEILDGRVKTLHPRIFGGILAIKDSDTHKQDLEKENITGMVSQDPENHQVMTDIRARKVENITKEITPCRPSLKHSLNFSEISIYFTTISTLFTKYKFKKSRFSTTISSD